MSENLVKSLREVSPKLSLLTCVLDDDILWLMIKHYRKFTFFREVMQVFLGFYIVHKRKKSTIVSTQG